MRLAGSDRGETVYGMFVSLLVAVSGSKVCECKQIPAPKRGFSRLLGTLTEGVELPFGVVNSFLFGCESWHSPSARFLNQTFGIKYGLLGSVTHKVKSVINSYEDFVHQPVDHSEPGAPTLSPLPPPAEPEAPTPAPTAIRTPKPARSRRPAMPTPTPGITYIWHPDQLPTDRRRKLADKITNLHDRVNHAVDHLPSNTTIQKLTDDILAKMGSLAASEQLIQFYEPAVPQAQTKFKLLNIVPKNGFLIEPHILRQFVSVITRVEPEVIAPDYVWYPGVEGTLTLGADQAIPIGRIVFQLMGKLECSIKTVAVYFFSQLREPLGISTGYLRLNNEDTIQEFQLPSFVEARLVRVVVTENWGDPNRTCLRGIAIVHA
jgi:hypothetical protein